VQSGGAVGLLALFDRLPALADEETDSNSTSGSGSSSATASKSRKTLVDTDTWYRFRGEGFRMTIPPDYQDIVEYDVSLLASIGTGL